MRGVAVAGRLPVLATSKGERYDKNAERQDAGGRFGDRGEFDGDLPLASE